MQGSTGSPSDSTSPSSGGVSPSSPSGADSVPDGSSRHPHGPIGSPLDLDSVLGFADCGSSLVAVCRSSSRFQFYSGRAGEAWTPLEFSITPFVRDHFATARVSEHEFLLLGGDTPSFDAYLCNHFKSECDALTVIGPTLPVMTKHAAASFYFRGKTIVYIFGGYRYTKLSRSLLLLCVKDRSCSAREWEPWGGPPARVGHSFVFHGGQLYLFGGQGEGGLLLDDFWVLNITSAPLNPQWQRLATGPPARRDHTAWSSGGALFVAGGVVNRRRLNDIWRFTTAWTKVSLFDPFAKIQGCDQGLCILGRFFTLFDFARVQNPLGTSFAKLAAKRDRFAHRQATHDRLYLAASTRVNELGAVLKEIREQPGKRTDDFVSPERLRAVERELSELNVTLLRRVTEFWSGVHRFAFSEPQKRVPLKTSLLCPYLKSLLAVRDSEIRFKEAEGRLAQKIHTQTRDAIVQKIERMTEAPLAIGEPIDPVETPVARVDDAMLSYLYSAQLRVIEQNTERIRALESLRQRPAADELLRAEKVMEVSMTMKTALQKKVQVEAELRKWKDLVLESEQELRRLETCLHFGEDSEGKKAEQTAELEKLTGEIKRLEAALRKDLSDLTGDRLDQIKKLYKITEDLRNQYKPGTIEEARTTFGVAEGEIRSLLKKAEISPSETGK